MSSRRMFQAWSRRTLVAVVACLCLVSSLGLPAAAAKPPGGGGGQVTPPKLTAVVSVSRHRLLATYDKDLDAAALQASTYAISSTQAVNLPVTAVSRASNNQAFLITGAQEAVTYQVTKPAYVVKNKPVPPITFTGSVAAEPKLVSVRPLSMAQIVVTFSEPMAPEALLPSSYALTVDGAVSTLAVTGVASFGSTGTEVLLTTTPQEALPYILNVGDIRGAAGIYMDPTANTMPFSGSTVLPGPMLVNATADGSSRVILTFESQLDPETATVNTNYTGTPNLFITSATLQADNKQVVLETSPQYQVQYSVVANVKGANGYPVNPSFNSASFTGAGPIISNDRPKVATAASTSNKTIVVQFSKPMADGTADPSRYTIVQTVVHPEVGALIVTGAKFVGGDRKSVELTTMSQTEVTYQVTVNNVTDLMGNPLADKTNFGGVIVDPTSFTFPGTPPAYLPCPREGAPVPCVVIDERVNSDGDTLYDHEETRGWQITIQLANGGTQVRQVTSNPYSDDTDHDFLKDHEERALNIDPRDHDTDDDGLTDWTEFNEFYSDPTKQDSDADGLYDGLEVATFKTSPIFDDTDGDQLKDGYEINVNRNAKVADLPQPILTLGDMRLGLDVRFTESNGEITRELDSRTVEATLVQSEEQQFSRSESTSHEVATKAAFSATARFEHGMGIFSSGWSQAFEFQGSTETTNTNSWTSAFTDTSSTSTQQAYTESLSTEQEVSRDSHVTRDAYAARVQLGVFLEGRGNVAFTVRNLQVAALIQDEDDPARLTPIATLVPTTGLDTSFTLGPLVPPKGPVVFTSTDASPELVQQLMRNPRGLVFRFANYDVVDEAGRNFAFISQEINDRTARIAIDYGGFDADGDGRGAESEILRVATGIIGRSVEDSDHDGDVDENDPPVVFDLSGKPVGITLRDALEAAGLKWYNERDPATTSDMLTPAQRRDSFSTITTDDGRGELIFRIRERRIDMNAPQQWLIITPNGIDPLLRLDERILYPGSNVELAFMADEDEDRLPALTEAMHGCIDSPTKDTDGKFLHRDTDGDDLDDRFEVLIGWDVNTPLHRGRVRSDCNSTDSDNDMLPDRDEAPGIINYDAAGLVLFNDGISAPRTVSDLTLTSASRVVKSPSANFTFLDVGATIEAVGLIPAGATIASVQSPTQATMTTFPNLLDDSEPPLPLPPGQEVVISATIGALYTAEFAPQRATTGPRSVTDLDVVSGSALVYSPSTARFTDADVGVSISGPGIPAGTTIASVQGLDLATMTAKATATGVGEASIGLTSVDKALYDPVTDPLRADTDLDGLSDRFELVPYKNALDKPVRKTSPEHPDSDFDQLFDGVERQLGADPRATDRAAFWDSDRDGLTDAQEVADDNLDFVIDDNEKAGAGWDVVVTQMHGLLESRQAPYQVTGSILDTTANARDHTVDKGQSLRVGMVVSVQHPPTATVFYTSVDKVVPASGDDAVVTFGTAFTGAGQLLSNTICHDGACPAQHVTVTRKVHSSKYDSDSDNDGLSDFEEWTLKTDPGDPNPEVDTDGDGVRDSWDLDRDGVRDSWDTDNDGLTDFEEVRGFTLADESTVKTKPTHVDTDNDRRSDGDEAGLAGGEFVVRLPAGNIYTVSTHPLQDDTDADQMVDGDEQTFAIDPTKPNTDGDNLSDYSEVHVNRRPEVPDMHVKLDVVRLFVPKDAEPGNWLNGTRDHGDFKFSLDVVRPNGVSELVVNSVKPPAPPAPAPGTAVSLPTCTTDPQSLCWVTTGSSTIIRIQEGESLPLGKQVTIGSVSTTDSVPEHFGFQGYVEEWDEDDHTELDCRVEIFPDLFGNSQDGPGLVKGSQLRLGVNSIAIHRAVETCANGDPLDFTLVMSYTAT